MMNTMLVNPGTIVVAIAKRFLPEYWGEYLDMMEFILNDANATHTIALLETGHIVHDILVMELPVSLVDKIQAFEESFKEVEPLNVELLFDFVDQLNEEYGKIAIKKEWGEKTAYTIDDMIDIFKSINPDAGIITLDTNDFED